MQKQLNGPERCTHSGLENLLFNGDCWWNQLICLIFRDSLLIIVTCIRIEWGILS